MAENLTDAGWVIIPVPVPPELVAIGCAPDLQRFFDAMIYKLRRNAHKGKWETLPLEKAFADLHAEVEELDKSIASGSTAEILMEAADVANEALIVANIALEARSPEARLPDGDERPGSDRRERQDGDGVTRFVADSFEAAGKGPPGFRA